MSYDIEAIVKKIKDQKDKILADYCQAYMAAIIEKYPNKKLSELVHVVEIVERVKGDEIIFYCREKVK